MGDRGGYYGGGYNRGGGNYGGGNYGGGSNNDRGYGDNNHRGNGGYGGGGHSGGYRGGGGHGGGGGYKGGGGGGKGGPWVYNASIQPGPGFQPPGRTCAPRRETELGTNRTASSGPSNRATASRHRAPRGGTRTPVAYPQPHGPGGRARSRCRSRHDYFFGKYNAQLTRRTSLSVTRHDGSSLAGAGPALPGRAAGRPPRPTAMKALLLLHTQLPPHAILCLPCRGRAARGGHNMRPSIGRTAPPSVSWVRRDGICGRHHRYRHRGAGTDCSTDQNRGAVEPRSCSARAVGRCTHHHSGRRRGQPYGRG